MKTGSLSSLMAAVAATLATPLAAEPLTLPTLEAAIEDGVFPKTTSVVIRKDDAVIYERYFEGGSADKLNDTRSATKSLVAMAIGKAIEQGHIASVDDRIWPLFAKDRDVAASKLTQAITYRDLLTMTSSLHCDDNNDTPGNEERMYPTKVWTDFALSLPSQPDWERAEDGLGSWRYCTAGSFLLGQALERATGVPVDRYIERELLQPLGIERQNWDRSPSGEVQTGGGLELTAAALVDLALMVANDGRARGQQLLSSDWIREMTTWRRDTFFGMGYGYQMWVKPYELECGTFKAWFMAGNGGNHILSFKDHGLAIAITREHYNNGEMHFQTMEMVEKHILGRIMCTDPATLAAQ